MSNVWVPNKQVHCPLCDEPFKVMKLNNNGKIIKAYVCKSDNVMILPFDPMFDKWRDHDKHIPCPQCHTPMKWFARMLDCYMKCECPSCGLIVEKDSDMAIEKGEVEVEDMAQPEPEVIDIQIPVDRLNIPADKKEAIKKKIRERREKDA